MLSTYPLENHKAPNEIWTMELFDAILTKLLQNALLNYLRYKGLTMKNFQMSLKRWIICVITNYTFIVYNHMRLAMYFTKVNLTKGCFQFVKFVLMMS